MAAHIRESLLARVSSEEQVEGYSLDAQCRAFRGLVEARTLPIPTTFAKGRFSWKPS